MKADIEKQVRLLRQGLRQLLMTEKQNVINGTPCLRNKQFEALYALAKMSDAQVANSYYKLPTGFGKTVMFSYMAQAYLNRARVNNINKKLVILVPRLNLINQTNEKLDVFAGFSASEFSGRCKNVDADVIVSTYQSLENLINVLGIENIGMVFADEAHHILGEKISQLMTMLTANVPTIGFTATPTYDVNKSVSQILNNEVYSMSLAEGVRHGVLAPVKNVLYCSSVVFDLEQAELTKSGEYDYESIIGQIDIESLTDEIADIYVTGYDEDTGHRFSESKAIINCPNIKIAKYQADAINKKIGKTVACAFSSEMQDFETEKQNFIDGHYTVACQVNTLTEGFDDTSVNLCINYPTHSYVKAEQTAGRAIRLDDNKPNKVAFVVDTVFKKHENDMFDNALRIARYAKQVLFKDVAGSMVLKPKEKQIQTQNVRNLAGGNDKSTVVKPYKIITSSEVLMNLHALDVICLEEEKILEKTDEWLATADLRSYVMGRSYKLSDSLKNLQFVMPDKIQLRKPKGNAAVLCLHISAIDEFTKRAGLIRRNIIPEKTDEWLATTDLQSYIMGGCCKLLDGLKSLQSVMPDNIQLCKSNAGAAALCLHISAIDEFVKRAGLTRYNAIPEKTSEWLATQNLKSYIVGCNNKVSDKLKELQAVMPENIQLRQPKGKAATLCLHISAIDEFTKRAGVTRRNTIPEKTSEWLTAMDLNSYIVGRYAKVSDKLKELQVVMPGKIQLCKPNTGAAALCLHISAIDEFTKRAGLTRRGDVNVSKSSIVAKVMNSNVHIR